jgi:multidrug efflux pump subunit AcrB
VSQGQTPGRYSLARAMNSGGDNYGELILNFYNYKDAYRLLPEIQNKIREEYPDAYVRVRKFSLAISTTHSVEVLFSGPDPAVLRELSAQAEEIMRNSPEIDPASVCNNWQSLTKTMYAQYNELQAKNADVNREDIAKALLASTQGLPVGVIFENDKMLIVNLNVCDTDGEKLTDLEDVLVWNMIPNVDLDDINVHSIIQNNVSIDELTNDMFRAVPLSQVTDGLRVGWNESLIYRYDGDRAIEAQCEPILTSTFSIAKRDIQEKIEAIPLPLGYSMKWIGEGETQNTAIANILGYLPLILIIIFVILLLLFNSIKKMVLILFCLPFAAIGCVLAMLITNTPFTFMGIIGAVGLLGMLIKNAIVLVDEITRMTNEGVEPYTAVIESTINRTRPVVMASATTILGMLPLITDPMYGSLAVIVIGGLTIGTIITLILLPIFYTALFRVKKPQTYDSQ